MDAVSGIFSALISVFEKLDAVSSVLILVTGILIYLAKRYRYFGWVYGFIKKHNTRDQAVDRLKIELADLNRISAGQSVIYGVSVCGMPKPRRKHTAPDIAHANLLGWTTEELQIHRGDINVHPDNAHGLVTGSSWRDPRSRELTYNMTKYSTIVAARKAGYKPEIISCGAILFDPITNGILLMKRSPEVATYPSCLHILGGNYEPAGSLHKNDDGEPDPLCRTALREIKEETDNIVVAPKAVEKALVLIAQETTTGFVQYVYAGIYLTPEQSRNFGSSEEGDVELYSMNEICNLIERTHILSPGLKWVPSGLMLVAAWLAMGAPDQYGRTPKKKIALESYARMKPTIESGFYKM